MSTLVVAQGVTKTHRARGLFGTRAVAALAGVDFEIKADEWVVLAGASGCGKTTLARILAGLDEADEGLVLWRGQRSTARERRAHVAWIPQDAGRSLNPRFTAREAIGEPVEIRKLDSSRLDEAVELARLDRALLQRRIPELSGGQRARVAIARALTVRPELLILDESLASLDIVLQRELLDALAGAGRRSCLFVAHETAVLEERAARLELMENGRLVAAGTRVWVEWRAAQSALG